MNIFDRKINFDALFKFSRITPSTQQHLKKVYASFALGMFVAAAGSYVHVVTHFIQAGLLSALGSLILMIWLMATPHSHETEQKRLGLLAGFAFLTGVGLGPALEFCIAVNPSILPTAFMGTAMIFTCFTLSALYARLMFQTPQEMGLIAIRSPADPGQRFPIRSLLCLYRASRGRPFACQFPPQPSLGLHAHGGLCISAHSHSNHREAEHCPGLHHLQILEASAHILPDPSGV
ncbi:hypothetical protein H8959_000173 [Pygathrix nigripes]